MSDLLIASKSRLAGSGLIIILLLLIFATTKPYITNAGNESSRLAAVQSFVDNGSFVIDNSIFKTVDRAWIDGHFYSTKPTLPIFWLSGIYFVLKSVFLLDFVNSYDTVVTLITFLGVGLFSVVLAFLFYREMGRRGAPISLSLLSGFSLIFSTWIYSYGTTINNHTPAACVLFGSFIVLRGGIERRRDVSFLWAGILFGTVINIDIPAGAIYFVGAFVSLLFTAEDRSFKRIALFLLGFLLMLIVMCVLNYATYGDIRPGYLVPGAYDFPGNIHSTRYAGLNRPTDTFSYYLHITFGHRGVFSYMPALLFFIPALLMNRRNLMLVDYAMLVSSGAFLIFLGTVTGNFGGWSYGFRYMIPSIPILSYFVCTWLVDNYRGRLAKVLVPFLIMGFVTSYVGAYNPWQPIYEGPETAEHSVLQRYRNSFLANLLCMSFERNPDSFPVRFLSRRVYDKSSVREYLKKCFNNRSTIHFNMGIALIKQGHLEEAVEHFQQALKIQPDFVDAYHYLGSVVAAQGDLDQAIGHFRQALRIQPEFAEAHESLGQALAEQGKRDEAVKHYEEALRIMKARRASSDPR